MPIRPPALDDRSFDDLVAELLARIPAHTPEWTHPRLGDPGRTLIELFAWLTDTLLYRANLIPERQRLAFLRLLGIPMRPAVPGRGLVSLALDDPAAADALSLRAGAAVKGPVGFETLTEVSVLPVTAEAYSKRPLSPGEQAELAPVLPGLREVHQVSNPVFYVTTPVFPGGAAEPGAFDVVQRTVDQCLWLALLAAKKDLREAVRGELGGGRDGRPQLLNVGVMPTIAVPALFEEIAARPRIPHVWELSTGKEGAGEPRYAQLDVVADSSRGLTRRGVLRLVLPAAEFIGAPPNDVRAALDAGVGDRPPRLDDADRADRLVAWLRLRPAERLQSLGLSWVGVNCVEIDQRQTITGRVIGQSDDSADQELRLPGQSVDPETFELQVEEPGRGYQTWQRIDDLALAGRDDAVRGRIPEHGMRVKLATMRAGGGRAGNLPPGSLAAIEAKDLAGAPVARKLKVVQPLATDGGEDPETLVEAERRIPALFRHRDRAVTVDDFRRLAGETPGVRLGRVEVLPRFKPHQRWQDVPGVVSVMVLPAKEERQPPNPRPDRPFLEAVHAHLDARRPLAAEVYTIGCEYVPLGLGVGVSLRDGSAQLAVLQAVREALRRFLWPLAPGGPQAWTRSWGSPCSGGTATRGDSFLPRPPAPRSTSASIPGSSPSSCPWSWWPRPIRPGIS
jgi:hypothetical protein